MYLLYQGMFNLCSSTLKNLNTRGVLRIIFVVKITKPLRLWVGQLAADSCDLTKFYQTSDWLFQMRREMRDDDFLSTSRHPGLSTLCRMIVTARLSEFVPKSSLPGPAHCTCLNKHFLHASISFTNTEKCNNGENTQNLRFPCCHRSFCRRKEK